MGSSTILVVEGICHRLLLWRQRKISTVGIVTVNYDYLFLQNPGSVTASQEESEKSYSGVPKKKVFFSEFLHNQFHNIISHIYIGVLYNNSLWMIPEIPS